MHPEEVSDAVIETYLNAEGAAFEKWERGNGKLADVGRMALAAAIAAHEAEQWRPIESAPERTRLLWLVNGYVEIGLWEKRCERMNGVIAPLWWGGAWVSDLPSVIEMKNSPEKFPTRWRPLPAPPTKGGGEMTPLNGVKTHPLTANAIEVLRSLVRGPCPSQTINPSVVNRLLREDLVTVIDLPSPYKTNRGKSISHLKITDAGRAVVTEPTNDR
jgi:hypothetical protein